MSHPSAKRHNQTGQTWRLAAIACATLLLSACNDKNTPIEAATAPAVAPASTTDTVAATQPVPYTPPSAEVLYQMVAPIALYPDKLAAQILAGATYPDQIGAAETWLAQNPGLQKTVLSNTVNAQSWDPSVKSLTQFPNVLEQMASNRPWTTALGKAYYNDPSDVMNAIQVMRNRAYKAGTLKTSKQLRVSAAPTPTAVAYTPGAMVTPLPEPVIEPPEQFIEIAPSQVDTVYVPQYDPGVVYGAPLPMYGGYQYVEVPPPVVVAGVPVVAGLLGFGAGIVLTESMHRHPSWGWNSWNMHWGDPDRPWRHGDRPAPPLARPAVVYNNTTYVSQSHTVVQNIRRTDNTYVNLVYENGGAPSHAAPSMQPQAAGAFAPPHGPQPSTLAAGAAVGAAALVASGHTWNQRQQPTQSPLTAVPQGRSGFTMGSDQPSAVSGTQNRRLPTADMAHAPNGNAFMPPHEQHSPGRSDPGLAGPDRQPQMQAGMMENAQRQRAQEQAQRQQQAQMQQQHAQEQAQRQQLMQQQAQEQVQRQQQSQMQQQRAQEQAQRQQLMQQQAQEQAQRQQQAQMQQQRAQEQSQRQQQLQQQAQAREQQRQQQAQMQAQQRVAQQATQQQAQRQAMQQQEQQRAAMRAQQQQVKQQARQATAARTEARPHGEHNRHENH